MSPISPTSLEFVKQILQDRPARRKIFEGACLSYKGVSSKTHVLVAIQTGEIWEVGLIPKQVDYDGEGFSSRKAILCKEGRAAFRQVKDCRMIDGNWKHFPE